MLSKCSTANCKPFSFYPNQLQQVEAGGVTFNLCQDCYNGLMKTLKSRAFLGSMYKASAMTSGEIARMRRERAEDYATSEFVL